MREEGEVKEKGRGGGVRDGRKSGGEKEME